jgi:hypothetical protein
MSVLGERHELLQHINPELPEPDPARQLIVLCAARAPSPAPREWEDSPNDQRQRQTQNCSEIRRATRCSNIGAENRCERYEGRRAGVGCKSGCGNAPK